MAWSKPGAGSILWLALLISVLLVGYVGLGGGGRGTDQYWYLADAETLARSWSLRTNNVFPAGLLAAGAVLPPFFVHNILSVWLAAVPTLAVGPLWGWLLLNLLATAGTAFLIQKTARRVAAPSIASLCALAYLMLPLSFWQEAQPLAEASTAFFAALALFFLARSGDRLGGWLQVTAALGGLYLSRASYLPALLLAVPAFFVLRARTHPARWRGVIGPTLVVALAAVVPIGLAHLVFAHQNIAMSYTRLLHTDVPGVSDNMFFNFDLSPLNIDNALPFSFILLWKKILYNLGKQLFDFGNGMELFFYWSFNLLTLVALWALWRCRHRPRERLLLLAALVPVGVHLLTIALFQNQFRYLLPAFPGLLVALAIALSALDPSRRLLERRSLAAMALLLLLMLPMDVALARTLHQDASVERRLRAQATALLDRYVPKDGRVLMAYRRGYLMFAYAARPRLVLFVRTDYGSADLARLRARFASDYLLAPTGSPVIMTLGAKAIAAAPTIDAFGTPWRIYTLPSATADRSPGAGGRDTAWDR